MTDDRSRPDHIFALLDDVMDGLRRELLDELSTGGAPETIRGLRASQLRLLSLTPDEGMRVTDLAVRVRMTKQALGEFAGVLEQAGLLETVRDPSDRRVRILRTTEQGRQAVADSEAMIADLERRWAARLGPDRWHDLRVLLAEASAS